MGYLAMASLICSRLKSALRVRKISESELARRINVCPSLISHWVNGDREPPLSRFADIVRVLNLPANWLLGIQNSHVEYCDLPMEDINTLDEIIRLFKRRHDKEIKERMRIEKAKDTTIECPPLLYG